MLRGARLSSMPMCVRERERERGALLGPSSGRAGNCVAVRSMAVSPDDWELFTMDQCIILNNYHS